MKKSLYLLSILCMAQAHSAIQIESSRIIYSGNANSSSVKINNLADENYIVQTWLDRGDDTTTEKLPMIVTPPLVKPRSKQSAILRFIYSGKGVPNDRESLFWVNVQEVPPKSSQENILQLAIRTRMKLFYRPPQVKNTLEQEVKKLSWQIRENKLFFKNDGPLHITLTLVEVADEKGKTFSVNIPMISPFSSVSVAVAQKTHLSELSYINDYGAIVTISPTSQ